MTDRRLRAAAIALAFVAGGALTIAAAPQTPFEYKKPAFEGSDRPEVHGFSVALVLGDLQGSGTADTLPPGARKALTDMREFLPYKSYRLLDTQWILCCGGGKNSRETVSGRLRGVDDQQYAFSIEVGWSGPRLSLRFSLRDVSEPLMKKSITTKLDEVRVYQPASSVKVEEAAPAQSPKANTAVIDSTFLMDVGETVVIGTSSVKGDKALVALLSAAPRAGAKK
jgi:hypothetical protein